MHVRRPCGPTTGVGAADSSRYCPGSAKHIPLRPSSAQRATAWQGQAQVQRLASACWRAARCASHPSCMRCTLCCALCRHFSCHFPLRSQTSSTLTVSSSSNSISSAMSEATSQVSERCAMCLGLLSGALGCHAASARACTMHSIAALALASMVGSYRMLHDAAGRGAAFLAGMSKVVLPSWSVGAAFVKCYRVCFAGCFEHDCCHVAMCHSQPDFFSGLRGTRSGGFWCCIIPSESTWRGCGKANLSVVCAAIAWQQPARSATYT